MCIIIIFLHKKSLVLLFPKANIAFIGRVGYLEPMFGYVGFPSGSLLLGDGVLGNCDFRVWYVLPLGFGAACGMTCNLWNRVRLA